MKKVSILIPAYNEEKNLINLLPEINDFINKKKLNYDFEIIVINDGSNDKTENTIIEFEKKINNLILINLKQNMGKAFALDIGIRKCNGEIIASIDADMQYNSNDFVKMIKKLDEGYDFVNGRRAIRKDNSLNTFFSLVYNFILRNLFNCKIYDFFSGIKVYKKKIYNLINLNSLPRFIIFFSIKYNYKLVEIEIEHKERKHGTSAYNFFDRLILSLQDIFVIFVCVLLGQSRIYALKQVLFITFFAISILFLFFSFNENQVNQNILTILITTFMMLIIFFKIIESFFEKKTEKLKTEEYIKSIF